jgi:hypothetical protein
MAPPSTKPTLPRIDPATLALETWRRAVDHIASLQMSLLAIDAVGGAPEPERTEVYRTVRTLAHYAVTGEGLDAPVQEYLISLIPLYSSAVGDGTVDVDGLVDGADPETELGLVIAAATARELLDTGLADLDLGQLAVLSGLSRRQLQQLAASEEIAVRDGEVAPAEARRWLAARGVPGVSARAPKRSRR